MDLGTFFIELPLLFVGASRGDDSYVQIPGRIFLQGMDDKKQNHTASTTYGVPTLFTFYNAFHPTDLERVIKDKDRGFEADTVFFLVRSVLGLIPGKHV
jgi:hypothetical protein